jgi:hypothetical protein
MSALAEFLRTEGKEIARLAADRQQILDEWRRDVEAFLALVRSAVEAADAEHVLFLKKSTRFLREQRIGEYELPTLAVVLGNTEVAVEPRARFNVGRVPLDSPDPGRQIEGRIQIGPPGECYHALRVKAAVGFEWVIVDRDYRTVRPATAEVIQQVLLDLLK